MTRLIVAAGGGGDAVAAAMIHAALYGDEDQAVILTYAWDRLLIDPVPGPRGPDNFTGLHSLTPAVWTVPAEARPITPAGSTLPRLSAELRHTFALIDPRHGVEGVTRQLEELVDHLSPESIELLDVGGDILARGDEPTLKSPLADALTLAACCQVNAPVRLLVAGPGLDGELLSTNCAARSARSSTPSPRRTSSRSARSWSGTPPRQPACSQRQPEAYAAPARCETPASLCRSLARDRRSIRSTWTKR